MGRTKKLTPEQVQQAAADRRAGMSWRDTHGFTEYYQVNPTIEYRGEWQITQASIDYLIRDAEL